jgi:hypothetical protein
VLPEHGVAELGSDKPEKRELKWDCWAPARSSPEGGHVGGISSSRTARIAFEHDLHYYPDIPNINAVFHGECLYICSLNPELSTWQDLVYVRSP